MDVLIAVLPFADIAMPSMGASLLQAGITRAGFSARVRYFNIQFAELIGPELFEHLCGSFPTRSLIGEWFFAHALFGDQLPHEQEYLSQVLVPECRPELLGMVPDVLKARRMAGEFVDRCAEEIRRCAPRIVGFTTMFTQNCVCLAVARRLKQFPDCPVIVFGGANCSGEMGLQLLHSFPCIDYVCTGEGDEVFPRFLDRLLRDGDPRPIPGILKQGESLEPTMPEPVQGMDALPIPDYTDFMDQLDAARRPFKRSLLIETARGCWWGARQHCAFCGFDDQTIAFRSKSPERVFDELSYLLETYGVSRILCVDSILDLRYLRTLFPRIIESDLKPQLFYETKANLKFHQLRTLREGGVWAIQPGIESFSNEVLRRMRKGCTGLQNIQVLRWGQELGLVIDWNLLFGFPGEAPSEYKRMAKLVPLLTHLQPPIDCEIIRLDRYSPYFENAEEHGITGVRPIPAYRYIYPLPRSAVERIAYHFDFEYGDGRVPHRYALPVQQEVQRWKELETLPPQRRPRLVFYRVDEGGLITDTRPCAVAPEHRLGVLAAEIYSLCDSAQNLSGLMRKLDRGASAAEIQRELEALMAARLMVEMDGHYLSLAVMGNRVPQEEELDDLRTLEQMMASLIPISTLMAQPTPEENPWWQRFSPTAIRIELSSEQRAQVREATGKEIFLLELTPEELEV